MIHDRIDDSYRNVESFYFVFSVIGLLFGLTVGVMQWLILRSQKQGFSNWILATIGGLAPFIFLLGLTLWWFKIDFFNWGSDNILILKILSTWGMLSGLSLGFSQWLILRKQFKYSHWWIFVNMVSGALLFIPYIPATGWVMRKLLPTPLSVQINSNKERFSWSNKIYISSLVALVSLLSYTQVYGCMKYNLSPVNQLFLITRWQNLNYLEQTLEGHEGEVRSLLISEDGRTLGSTDNRGNIKIWELNTGSNKSTLISSKKLEKIPGGTRGVRGGGLREYNRINISEDRGIKLKAIVSEEEVLLSRSKFYTQDDCCRLPDEDYMLWIENLETKELFKSFLLASLDKHITTTPDGKTIVSSDDRGNIRIWDLKTDKLKTSFESSFSNDSYNLVESIAITPDGLSLILTRRTGNIEIWDLKTLKLKKTFQAHEGEIGFLAISGDSQTLISQNKFPGTISRKYIIDSQ